MSKIIVSNASNTRELTVDLQNKKQAAQVVKDCHIDLPKKFFFIGVNRSSTPVNYRLEVECKTDNRLILAEGSSALYLKYREQQGPSIVVAVGKDARVLDFQLYFDPTIVVDCKEKESLESELFAISYRVKAVNEKSNETAATIEGSAQIRLQRLEFKAPVIEFVPNEYGNNLVYNIHKEQPEIIGELRVKNASDLLRTPACNITMRIVAKRMVGRRLTEVKDLMWYDSDIKQSNPRATAEISSLTPIGGDPSDFRYILKEQDLLELYNIDVNKTRGHHINDNVVTIPIVWDMTKVRNPIANDEKYCIHIEAKASSVLGSEHQEVSYTDLHVTLKRNCRDMDLEVHFMDDIDVLVTNGAVMSCVVPDVIPEMTSTYEFLLKNTAEFASDGKEGARIFIKDLSLPTNLSPYIKQKPGVRDSIFTFIDNDGKQISLAEEFALGIKEAQAIRIEYDHSCIDTITDLVANKTVYELTYKLRLTFKYYVDSNDEYNLASEVDESKFNEFKVTLPILLRKAAKPEWMCIDLGTSAIVASYGTLLDNAGKFANTQIMLGKQKQALMSGIFKSDKNKISDTSESDLRFINSTTAVNITTIDNSKISSTATDDYIKMCLWLSPTTGMVDFYARMLPSLKSIVGHNIFPATLLPHEVKMSERDPIKVESIFENIYKQLFNFFIPREHSLAAENVVMTVPNTYTPHNITVLRGILYNAMPQLRNIRFISESDAAVFYYLSRREHIFRNTENVPSNIDNSVLVYDMGAGTLDLTYITRTLRGNNTEIEFKGKLGVSRAGNYLDYLIADIIIELLKRPNVDNGVEDNRTKERRIGDEKSLDLVIALNNQGLTPAHRKSAGVLKSYVRNVVKPMLNMYDNKSICDELKPEVQALISDPAFTKYRETLSKITVADIKMHPKMMQYLEEISSEIFTHFKGLFSKGGDVIKPSLLIFSGRSTSLKIIRKAVNKALSEVLGCNDCKFLDLSQERILDLSKECDSTDNEGDVVTSEKISSLKTVVVDGAMAFCNLFGEGNGSLKIRNRNVYAQYGVMFLLNDGTWEWVPMLDASTQAINEDSAKLSNDGTIIYEYDTRVHRVSNSARIGNIPQRPLRKNFNDVAAIYVLQSYSNNTEDDWNNGHRDLITIIGATSNFANIGDREYYMTINRYNKISFHIGNAQIEMYPREDTISESFKKSMWPIVENKR
ncbi:MAG: hypothetical protein IJX40_06505 [Alistipes sp.]|nr:hypothetical protein [Alistipes sp.]MBQ8367369.1 hypothetical protein [Alistipes sp.]